MNKGTTYIPNINTSVHHKLLHDPKMTVLDGLENETGGNLLNFERLLILTINTELVDFPKGIGNDIVEGTDNPIGTSK